MQIRFYGRLAERLGKEVAMPLPGDARTVSDLRALLAERFPELSTDLLTRTRACMADAFVREDQPLAEDDTVEFFPPLSGG